MICFESVYMNINSELWNMYKFSFIKISTKFAFTYIPSCISVNYMWHTLLLHKFANMDVSNIFTFSYF